jgi:hypothetical protein
MHTYMCETHVKLHSRATNDEHMWVNNMFRV